MLNGIPADKLMTRATNQSFDDFYVKNLNIENLHAETIKGIRVDEAARKSRINVIKGNILSNLNFIKKKLISLLYYINYLV